ncbi:hypothetical protein CORC01_02339, partial [Colletotrichum orchidophilum]
PTPSARPRARPQTGTRSSPPSIQFPPEGRNRFPCGKCESNQSKLHSRVSRISIINQGGICSSFREPRVGRIL